MEDVSFAWDGTSVVAVLRDGHAVQFFKLQPAPEVLRAGRSAGIEALDRASCGTCVWFISHADVSGRRRKESTAWVMDDAWLLG